MASLRAIPGLCLVRPGDANETAMAWRVAVERNGPVGLVLSRQNLPVLEGTANNSGVLRGAYVLRDTDGPPALVIIGTGSEVALAVDAAQRLCDEGISTRVVSMPSWELFAEQTDSYRSEVLPSGVPTVSVEAGVTFGWERFANASVGIDRFGASAPGDTVMDRLGINVDNLVATARDLLERT